MKKYEIIFWTSKSNGALNYYSIESDNKEITDFCLPNNIIFVDVKENIIKKDNFNQNIKTQKEVKCYYFGRPATLEDVKKDLRNVDKKDIRYKANLEFLLESANIKGALLYRGMDNRIRGGSKIYGEIIEPEFINDKNKYTGYAGKDYFDLE